MTRRLLAFALVFVVAGGLLAGDICEAVCARHQGHSIDSSAPAPHHHHAGEAAAHPAQHHRSDAASTSATRRVGFVPLPHPCGHLEAMVTESRELARAPMVRAIVTMAGVTPPLVHVLPLSELSGRQGPPTPTRRTSPLRI